MTVTRDIQYIRRKTAFFPGSKNTTCHDDAYEISISFSEACVADRIPLRFKVQVYWSLQQWSVVRFPLQHRFFICRSRKGKGGSPPKRKNFSPGGVMTGTCWIQCSPCIQKHDQSIGFAMVWTYGCRRTWHSFDHGIAGFSTFPLQYDPGMATNLNEPLPRGLEGQVQFLTCCTG